MGMFLIAASSCTVILCLLIFLHEWGHFAAARLLGVRVEVFSIGFGPRISSWQRGVTEYRVSILPFGGYVKMAGDNPFKPRSGAPDEFLSQARWRRAVIALAGPAINFVISFFLFWGSFWLVGIPHPAYLTQSANVVAIARGLQSSQTKVGDVIVAVNGLDTPSWDAVFAQAAKAPSGTEIKLIVIRDGVRTVLTVKKPEGAYEESYLGYPLVRPRVDSVDPNTPAAIAGLKPGDLVASVNGVSLVTWPQFIDMVHLADNQYPVIVVLRGQRAVPLHISELGGGGLSDERIGASPKLDYVYHRQGFIASMKGAARVTYSCVKQIGDIFRDLLAHRSSIHELQGVVGIAQQSGKAASHGPAELIDLAALISLNLGLLNLLPIPVLDGGHFLMLAIEGCSRRDINLVLKQRLLQAGLIFLLLILAVTMFNDIQRIIQSY